MVLVVPVLEMLAQHRRVVPPGPVSTERIPVVMDDAASPLEDALERNGEDLGWFLERTTRTLGGRWPWAWIFFPRCYPLAGHLRAVRSDPASMPFTLYGLEPEPKPAGWTPCVGAVLPMSKEDFRDTASKSPLFESAWNALADCSPNGHWACLTDPLDEEWVESVRDPVSVD
jgi:hypothetical protein